MNRQDAKDAKVGEKKIGNVRVHKRARQKVEVGKIEQQLHNYSLQRYKIASLLPWRSWRLGGSLNR
ncbi:MAG TPA: hypothetical protein DCY88_24745 [Cyanobacteria bacterium UBA11372]|nr:hypothetical protein [Cyanobacteria bacterium UBA11372]